MKIAIALAKNILAPLETAAAASAIKPGIQKKIHGSGTTTLMILNKEMDDIMKIIQAPEDSLFDSLRMFYWREVTKTIKNETKKQKGGFLNILLGTFGASSLKDMLAGFKNFLIPLHHLINLEIKKYYKNET